MKHEHETSGVCGCEATVKKSAHEGKGGNENPTCCCGKKMGKKS